LIGISGFVLFGMLTKAEASTVKSLDKAYPNSFGSMSDFGISVSKNGVSAAAKAPSLDGYITPGSAKSQLGV